MGVGVGVGVGAGTNELVGTNLTDARNYRSLGVTVSATQSMPALTHDTLTVARGTVHERFRPLGSVRKNGRANRAKLVLHAQQDDGESE